MLKRSWCEIDLNRLKENYIICKRKLENRCDITAVVKADAYGHGAKEVALALQKVGCKNFAVATVSEGEVLRKRGVVGKILILGYTPPQMLKNVFKEKLCQTVFSKEYADLVCKERLPLEIQIAVDTGMNRIGFKWKNDSEIIETIENLSKTAEYCHDAIRQINNGSYISMLATEIYNLYPVSHTAFIKEFKNITGKTLVSYLQSKKLEYAKTLLLTTDYSVLYISSLLNYDSLSYFIRIFKEEYNLTPYKYRKNNTGTVFTD